jgi:hypothetical protein
VLCRLLKRLPVALSPYLPIPPYSLAGLPRYLYCLMVLPRVTSPSGSFSVGGRRVRYPYKDAY